jgi:TolB-like protein
VVAKVSQYRGKGQDVRKIGKELGATVILEGSLREEGGRVGVTVQVIDSGASGRLGLRHTASATLNIQGPFPPFRSGYTTV